MSPKPLICLLAVFSAACSDPLERRTAGIELSYQGTDLSAYLDCVREQGATLLQAHRAGARPGAAENSLAAIRASLGDGAVFVEIDVARTSDGVLVLMHDDTLERTSTGTGTLASLAYPDLAALALVDPEGRDTGEPVPTLVDALRALDGRGFAQIDRKRSTSFEDIARVIETEQAAARTVVITYTIDEAIVVHRRLPDVMISTGIDNLEDLERLRGAGVDLSRVTAWLGLGDGRPALDGELAALGIETSYGDFRGERDGSINYETMAGNGAEVLSVDDVRAAANALEAGAVARAVFGACPLARGDDTPSKG